MRPKFRIARVSYTIYGTFGVLLRQQEAFGNGKEEELPVCVTLENPWHNNMPNISCIPVGLYLCRRIDSPHFGDSFEVADVPDRTHIIFHKGNTEIDTKGCVLLGRAYGHLSGMPAILESNKAVVDFMNSLEDESEFDLAIVDSDGLPF
jgi:Family of unknown function (DUF5675)